MPHRKLVLWAWFVGAHILVVALGWVLPSQPMGDVYNVYEPWSRQALSGGPIVGITEPWVYPQLALIPMVAAWAFAWVGNYTLGWAVLVCLCNAAAFAVLIGRKPTRARSRAALGWLVFLVALGPVGLYRIDAITVPLAICALLLVSRAPAVSGALLALGVWIKIWPAAAIGALVVAVRRGRWRIAAGAVTAAVAVMVVLVAIGGGPYLFGFVSAQVGRGLQMESTAATPFVWLATLGVPGYQVGFNPQIITFEVTGPGVDAVAAAMTPLMAIAAIGVYGIGAWQAWRGVSFARLAPPLLLSAVLVLIVFNKVGSPQFLSWLIAPLVLWIALDEARIRSGLRLAVITLALTQLVYPIAFDLVRIAYPIGTVILTARNVMLVVLLVWMLRRLITAGSRGLPLDDRAAS